MARISQDQVQERQAFLLELFRNQPDISRNEAMDEYKTKFGATLNAKTFNELREKAQNQVVEVEKVEERETESETSADDVVARLKTVASAEQTNGVGGQPAAKKPKAKVAGAKNVFVDATPEQLQFLERVVQQLQESGASNVKIDYATDRWMVLTVDTK
jgi:H2-forming N5,N10-methylenetetrahydromethanopterin dehydrogenase-like enzyme